jgi:hypothetical protein
LNKNSMISKTKIRHALKKWKTKNLIRTYVQNNQHWVTFQRG